MDDEPKRGRGRPKGTGKLDPDDIVVAAYEALARGGYGALTMRGVARSLGVSLATVQHHYPTKESLWRAAIERLVEETTSRWDETPPEDLRGVITGNLEQASRRPGLQAALLTDQSPGHEERLEYYARLFRETGERSNERARQLEAAELTRAFDHQALFLLITIGIGSIASARHAVKTLYGYDLESEKDRRRLATALADIIAFGLLPR